MRQSSANDIVYTPVPIFTRFLIFLSLAALVGLLWFINKGETISLFNLIVLGSGGAIVAFVLFFMALSTRIIVSNEGLAQTSTAGKEEMIPWRGITRIHVFVQKEYLFPGSLTCRILRLTLVWYFARFSGEDTNRYIDVKLEKRSAELVRRALERVAPPAITFENPGRFVNKNYDPQKQWNTLIRKTAFTK